MGDERLRLIARAWASYERMLSDKAGSHMGYAQRRDAHQAFYAGGAVMFHLLKPALKVRGKEPVLDALRAEIGEWSDQFDGTFFGEGADEPTH